MLQTVEIKNFRCLHDVKVSLRPLTVLIGPNDTGKSAFLAALQHLSVQSGFGRLDRWRLTRENEPRICGQGDGGARLVAEKGDLQVSPEHAREQYCPSGLFCLPSGGVALSSVGYPDDGGAPALSPSGENVPSLLDYLLRRDRNRFFAFVKAMCSLIPGFEEVEIATPDAQTRRIDLVIEKGLRIPADHASSGIRLLFFFAALAYHPTPPRLIMVEEPETGVHPKRLGEVTRLLREITQGKHGDHAAQVVLTTHSPHLLDFVDIETDQVLVFRRNDDGSRSAEPVDAKRLKNFLDEFKLGEVWFNEDEAGLVGRDG